MIAGFWQAEDPYGNRIPLNLITTKPYSYSDPELNADGKSVYDYMKAG
jgi:hypothetical protein